MEKQKLPLFKILLFSITPLVILLLMGEVYCRIRMCVKYNDSYYLTIPFFKKAAKHHEVMPETYYIDRFPQGYFKIRPGVYRSLEQNYEFFTINSLGFRGKEFMPFDKSKKLRIFCIGESSTFGAESPDDQTWPARLGYYLNQNGKGGKFEVINSGFPCSRSPDYTNLVQYELTNYKPDIFIIYVGFNDLVRTNEAANILFKLHRFLQSKSMLYRSCVDKLFITLNRANKSPVAPSLVTVGISTVFKANLEKIIKISLKNNIKIIFIRQVLNVPKDLFVSDDLPLAEIKKNFSSLKDKFDKSYAYPAMFYYHNKEMRELASLCEKYKIEFYDFRKDFYGYLDDKSIFYDHVHLFPEGNDLLASLISKNLLAEENRGK